LLDGGEDEEAAVLLAGVSETDQAIRLLVREVVPVPDPAFRSKGPAYLSIDPDFLAPLVKRCRLAGWAFVLAHSHPFSRGGVSFSGIDDAGERALFPRIQARVPGRPTGALVFGADAVAARVWLPGAKGSSPVGRLVIVGEQIEGLDPNGRLERPTSAEPGEGRYARQVLALGQAGQRKLGLTRVAVVGAGGTGSQVYQQLVHLGVRHVDVIDPQVLEESNLSRVVTSKPADIGRPKVEVLAEWGAQVQAAGGGEQIVGDVRDRAIALGLRDADVIFCCTDSLQSRLVLNRLARQYLIPLIDLGIDIQLVDGQTERVRAIGGRVMVVTPDGPCLGCLGVLDPAALQRESAPSWHASYLAGQDLPDPSVISFNGVISSLAVTEFLNLVTGFAPRQERLYQRYDGIRGIVRAYPLRPEQPCTCADLYGLGDGEPLPHLLARPHDGRPEAGTAHGT
ncbi:MAG: ThiF family adenylyltransferase, partial [Chloroflexi bacterium]|nr:ThiF family adenylyltransferase [Chloroflexota bacterium]